MTASRQVTNGYWAALVIGAAGPVGLILIATAAVVRRRRHHSTAKKTAAASSTRRPYPANHPVMGVRLLIEEAMIVRDRLSGHIDAATYQDRMHDLVSGQHSPSPHAP